MITVIKKGNIVPLKIFKTWWDCGTWCDEHVTKDKGFDPTQYEAKTVRGFKKYLYLILLWGDKIAPLTKTINNNCKNNFT